MQLHCTPWISHETTFFEQTWNSLSSLKVSALSRLKRPNTWPLAWDEGFPIYTKFLGVLVRYTFDSVTEEQL